MQRHPGARLSVNLNQVSKTQVRAAQFEILQSAVARISKLSARFLRCPFGHRLWRKLRLQQILCHLAQKIAAIPILEIAVAGVAQRGLAVWPQAKHHSRRLERCQALLKVRCREQRAAHAGDAGLAVSGFDRSIPVFIRSLRTQRNNRGQRIVARPSRRRQDRSTGVRDRQEGEIPLLAARLLCLNDDELTYSLHFDDKLAIGYRYAS